MAKNRLNVILGVDVTQLTKGLKSAEGQLSRFSKSIGAVGRSLTQNLTVPIAILAGTSVKTFADFELSLAKVKAVSGATGKAFDSLKASALELGRTTQFTASQVAGLQLNLSKLGFSPEEIEQSTAAILDLALATGEDLAESAGVAASTLRGFGLDATETIRVTNVMADSFSSTALDLEKFGIAMAYVAPVANQAGASIEQTTALLGSLVNRGLDASSAGAALRNIFLDIAEKGLSLNEAMDMVKNSTNPLATSMQLFGKRGATVATIIAENRDEITGLTADFIDSQGEARAMAAIMENTLSGSFELLKSAVEGAGISIGEILAPFVQKATQYLNDMVTAFNALNPETKKSIVRFALIAAAIGPVLLAISAVAKVAATLSGALKVATLAMSNFTLATLANPAILAFAVTLGVLYLAFQKLSKEVDRGLAGIKAVNDVREEGQRIIAGEEATVNRLIEVLKDETAERGRKEDALKQLQQISPEYFGSLDLEKSKLEDITKASENYRKSILLQAQAQAAVAKLTEIATKRIEALQKKQKIEDRFIELTGAGVAKQLLSGLTGEAKNLTLAYGGLDKEMQSLENQNVSLIGFLKEAEDGLYSLNSAVKGTKTKTVATLDIPKGAALGSGDARSETISPFAQVQTLNLLPDEIKSNTLAGLTEINAKTGELAYTTAALGLTSTEALNQYGVGIDTSIEAWDRFNAKLSLISNTVGSVLTGAFEGFFEVLEEGGTNAFEGFVQGAKKALIQLVKQLVIALAKAIAVAVVFSIIFPGASAGGSLGSKIGSLFKQFAGLPGLASGGIIPPGYPNDTFPARLSSGEAVIPLDKLNQYTGNNGGTLEARISGEDLLILMNRTEQKYKRFS